MADCDAVVLGGGPAGLRAAEIISAAGRRVILADRMPSVGRKFLVAGRGGLNLTHADPQERFIQRYRDEARWRSLLTDFSPNDLREWTHGLGVETFVGSSRRVFPTSKQAAPLLRRWIARLKKQGVEFRLRHAWQSLEPGNPHRLIFATPTGRAYLAAPVVVLATGGGSWPQTGSDATWISILRQAEIAVTPLAPANCGYEVGWPASFLAAVEGQPLKNVVVIAGDESAAGELLVTRYGLEGGALYSLGPALRGMAAPALTLDLKPSLSAQQLTERLHHVRPPLLEAARKTWKLGPVATELLRLVPVSTANALAELAKSFPLALRCPRPLGEAISSAGGVAWGELEESLMLRRRPGIFCAGEMIDWEAPTGGFLLQGCFATGTRAARGALAWLAKTDASPKKLP